MKALLFVLFALLTLSSSAQLEEKVQLAERWDDSGVIVYFSKAMTFYHFGNYEKAANDLSYLLDNFSEVDTSVMRKSGLDSAIVLNYRATCYSKLGEVEKAIKDYDQLNALVPDDSLHKINCVRVYYSNGYCDELVAMIDGNENNFEELNDAALCYTKLGKYPEALEYIEKAKLTDPENYLLYKTMGEYHKATEDSTSSCEAYEEAIIKLRASKTVAQRRKGHLEELILQEMEPFCKQH